ncbi:MAG: ATP-binding protein [Pseudomonadota bacterium]
MDRKSIEVLNPWWENPEAIKSDSHLQAIAGKHFYFDNPVKADLVFKKGKTCILRGARQVGKTTLMKEMIARTLTEEMVNAKDCLFLTCENIDSHSELRATIVEWMEGRKDRPVLVCLDEITFVVGWQRALLWLINSGLLANATTFISGSNARDLKEMGERFPGRKVVESRIYPLSPSDYRILPVFKGWEKNEILKVYSRVGGFPHAVRDYCERGEVTDETCETYANWIFGDAYRFKLAREVLLHILFRVYDTLASQVTWQRLIEKSPVRSHETAAAYVEHLESAFLCNVLSCYDPDKDMAAPRKAKKIYFIDPLLYQVAGGYLRGIRNVARWWDGALADAGMRGNLFESIVASQFAHQFERTYFWYSSSTGQEVDLVIRRGEETMLYEVKSRSQILKPAMGREVKLITPESFDF